MIHVAVAVIKNHQGQVLVQRRADDAHQGGLWEFPGGKVEAGETIHQALRREIQEELAVDVCDSEPLIKIAHDYGDRAVMLEVRLVTDWTGVPQAMEGQPLQWVDADSLADLEMPAADKPIVTAIGLSDTLIITPPAIESVDDFLQRFKILIKQGHRLFLYRVFSQPLISHAELLRKMREITQGIGVKILLHEQNADGLVGDGLHLTEKGLWEFKPESSNEKLLSASCHSPESLQRALELGADFVFLSPVLPTQSHPGEDVLGWETFSNWVGEVNLPVYALGGMTAGLLETAKLQGAQGIAGIGHWWRD